ncbi:YciI family protein [Ramlibacter sp. 2FC]|uniref:YciI family protein n=1 Tax=Ramlibacter sp. 2FC TaxID=2502188 RepID=UPI0010F869F1|nr:YciI family protein [Ramlibacter sp. 2FC]
MPYMLLIIEPPQQRRSRSEAEGRAVYERMLRFGDGLRSRGQLLAAESLASHATAARVQRRDDLAQVLDGPFAEAKEMVGGFYLIDCASFDEAIAIARECPAAEWAQVEVRALAPCYGDSGARPAPLARATT